MLKRLLEATKELKASDLFISVGLPPTIKVNGYLESLTNKPLILAEVEALLENVIGMAHIDKFRETKEANFALNSKESGRFRVSAFIQKEQPGMVIRRIENKIPSFAELHLPEQLKETSLTQHGLILFVGATGSGKSTTQAAMIGHRNKNVSGHILTIEDPIEFIHEHGESVITQREVGIDTESLSAALKNSLRQAPDVISIGEIRDQETMEFAIMFAETGHLCMATLHANNANQALERILHLLPESRHRQFLFDLSVNLQAIVAQQLIQTLDGKKRRVVVEILYNTPMMADAIRKGEMHLLKDIIKKSSESGMQTFDQGLFDLYEQGVIGYKEALAHADSKNDERLLIKLHSGQINNMGREGELDGMTLDI